LAQGLTITAGPIVNEVEARLFQADFCPEWELKVLLPVSAGDCSWEIVYCLFL
jgi:hypothetical protein